MLTDYKEIQFYGAIGKALKAARRNADMSQSELAHRAGCNRNTITNIETGVQGVSLYLASKIADVLPEWRKKL